MLSERRSDCRFLHALCCRNEWWVPGKLVEVRKRLSDVWRSPGGSRDVLLLDIALDNYFRCCYEGTCMLLKCIWQRSTAAHLCGLRLASYYKGLGVVVLQVEACLSAHL